MALGAPSIRTATPISTTRIDLAWVNGDEYDFVHIERKIAPAAFAEIDMVEGSAEYYADESPPLTPDETYDYRIRGRKLYPVEEYSGYSGIKSATTFAVLAAPSLCVATAFSDFIEIIWKDNSLEEVTFRIARNKDGAGWVEDFATIPANMDYYRDEPVIAASVYQYRVLAYRGPGDVSAASNVDSATALSAPVAPVLDIILAADTEDTSIRIRWSDVANETGYRIEHFIWYTTAFWSHAGLDAYDGTKVNDGVLNVATFETDTSAANSFLKIDLGAGNDKEFMRVDITIITAPANAIWDVEYSDNDAAWFVAKADVGGAPLAVGTHEFAWGKVGVHRYWRLLKTNVAVAGGEHAEVQFYEQTKVVGIGIADFLFISLDPGTIYQFKVRAYNGVSNSAYSVTRAATTDAVYVPTEFEKWIRNPSIEPVYLAEIYTKMDLVGFPLMSDDDLIGCWPFDELSGIVATDKSKSGNDGTLTNMEEADHVDGKVNKCLEFDGENDYVQVADILLSDSDPWSFSHWIKWDGQNDELYVFYAGRLTANRSFLLRQSDNNRFAFRDRLNVYHNFAAGSSTPYIGVWTHLAWIADGSGNLSLYINGELFGTLTSVPTELIFQSIGRGYTDYYFEGLIDEVRIYNRALTLAEVKALHDTPGHRIHEILIPAEDRGIDILEVFEGGTNYSKETSKADVQTNAESFYFHYDSRKLYLHTSADENPSDFLIEGAFWLYFSTHKDIEFTANGRLQHFLPLLAKEDIPNITQEIKPYFEGNFGMSSGSIAFMNAKIGGEHFFDEKFATYTWINAKVILKAGSDALPVFTYAQFKEIFTGYIDSKSCSDAKITFQLRDLRKVMKEPIVMDKYWKEDQGDDKAFYPDMDESHEGKPIPIVFGGRGAGVSIAVDMENQKFNYHNGRSKSVESVTRNSVELVKDTHYYVDLQRSIITFDRDGKFVIEAGVNDEIDFKEDAAVKNATIDPATYTTLELAAAMKAKMELAGGFTYTVTCSGAPERLFSINGVGGALQLLWKTGANGSDGTRTHIGTTIGYNDDEDDAGANTYIADNDMITLIEGDTILVAFTGLVNSADEVINNGAEVFKYLMNTYKSLTDSELDLDSIYQSKYANENALVLSLESEPSFDEIVRTIEHSIEAYTFQNEFGRLGIKPRQTVVASNAKYIISKHVFGHSQKKDRSTLFWKVNVYYNKDYNDDWAVKTAISNTINWKYNVTEELPIHTYFRHPPHAQSLATSILNLLNKEQVENELSMLLFDVMPGNLIKFSRVRFYDLDGTASEITLRVIRISKSPSLGRTSITTEIVS